MTALSPGSRARVSNDDRNPEESAVEEGLPDQYQHLPPGKDIETAGDAPLHTTDLP